MGAALDLTTALELVGDTRELTPGDIHDYETYGPAEPPTLDSVRQRHHRIANLLAQGLKVTEIARILSVTPCSIHMLKRNVAFQALVEQYRSEILDEDRMLAGQIRELAIQGLSKLQQELLEGTIAGDDVRKLVEGTLDRIGYGPTKKVERKSVTLSATMIEMVKEEVRLGEAPDQRPALGAGADAQPVRVAQGADREAEERPGL